jgi:DNA (cytosine-5)-methyltransferase 1
LHELKRFWLLDISGNKLKRPKMEQIETIVSCLKTKKQTQRVLLPEIPAPAALSIPDDACHYSESIDGLRTLTVREMARIQSFPDWYEVKSKVTTGGEQRRFEVPQYTQMGNAVPPMLGYALGQICKKLLSL